MSNPATDDRARLRRGVYLILIALAVGNFTGRILSVNAIDKAGLETQLRKDGRDITLQRPFLSGNDRSRWCTVRALVEDGTYSIDRVVREPNWDTIDMVKHDGQGNPAPEADQGHLYSSKPPLLATIMAGEYWILHKVTGKTLGTHPYELGRFMLWTLNVLPFIGYLCIVGRIAERYGSTDWGRIFVVACGALATYFTTFAIVFTNHWPAALMAAVALDAALRILYEGESRTRWYLVAGLAGGLMAAFELPALSFYGLLGVLLLVHNFKHTLFGFVPGFAVVLAASLGTNYAAHGTIRPAYEQRHVQGGWYDYQYTRTNSDGSIRVIDSYWRSTTPKSKVDQGEPDRGLYALHALVGHHGIFSLTPVWLLAMAGLAMSLVRGKSDAGENTTPTPRAMAAAILISTAVCLAFYVTRPLEDRNYGGMTSGFRWAFWFAPLWLFGMLPAVDSLSTGAWRRRFAAVLLALSVMSASYPNWNPWTTPWMQNWLEWRQ